MKCERSADPESSPFLNIVNITDQIATISPIQWCSNSPLFTMQFICKTKAGFWNFKRHLIVFDWYLIWLSGRGKPTQMLLILNCEGQGKNTRKSHQRSITVVICIVSILFPINICEITPLHSLITYISQSQFLNKCFLSIEIKTPSQQSHNSPLASQNTKIAYKGNTVLI